ncbi:MAG TPA: hypothetical protein VEF71_14110 [Streptosporangiaceae bacterium]|nr:hypothetical protein [Streptosporangiaceae bacterium]
MADADVVVVGAGALGLSMTALSPGRSGPLPDDTLISRGLWQYAHCRDPAADAPPTALS